MLFLPVKKKPEVKLDFAGAVTIYSNIVTKDVAKNLTNFAEDSNISGLHRRGSKTPEICNASFSTCLINDTSNEIYNILDSVWMKYLKKENFNITFIEPYEIKMYSVGDKFDYHHDGFGSIHHTDDRKINLIIQLSTSEEYEGGDLYVGDYICPRDFGTAIIFPAHYVHMVSPITKGTRISLIGHAWGPLAL